MTLPQLNLAKYRGTKATIHTNHGDLRLQLFDSIAPRTVKNFVDLAKQSYYDGQIFHRVIKDFMIQGGDPTGTGRGGESIYGEKFDDEFSEELFNLRGALSMANSGPNTNGSQFFIVQNTECNYPEDALVNAGWPEKIAKSYVEHGGTPHLDRRHTVFGQLLDEASYKVLDEIAAVETDYADRPKEPVIIKSISLEEVTKKASVAKSIKSNQPHIGVIIDAEVVGLQPYGLFVKFSYKENDYKGLIHVSEIRSGFVKSLSDEMKVGQKLRAQIIDIDEFTGKFSLSLRSLEEKPRLHHAQYKHYATTGKQKLGFQPIADQLYSWVNEGTAAFIKKQAKKVSHK